MGVKGDVGHQDVARREVDRIVRVIAEPVPKRAIERIANDGRAGFAFELDVLDRVRTGCTIEPGRSSVALMNGAVPQAHDRGHHRCATGRKTPRRR